MLKLLIFAMAEGVRSARELARRCQRDVRFMWLGHGVQWDHELFSDFLVRFGEASLKQLFKQTVLLGMQAGLITLQQVSVDGSKIAAHGARKTYSEENLDALLKMLDERLSELLAKMAAVNEMEASEEQQQLAQTLPKELADAKRRRERLQAAKAALLEKGWARIGETDLEAPVQKTQDGKRAGYNAQIAVDADSGMVLDVGLTDAQNDTHQLAPLLAGVVANTGAKPDVVAADTGYQSAESLAALDEGGFNGYVNQPASTDGRFGHEVFDYDAERDLYTCPGGHELPFKGTKDLRYEGCRVYRSSRLCCRDCSRRSECLTDKGKFRQLVVAPHGEAISAMRRKLKTEEGKAALKRRFGTVEPTFGVMKSVLGLRQFQRVGKEKAAAELTLASLAINLRKLVGWATSGGSPSQLRRADAMAA